MCVHLLLMPRGIRGHPVRPSLPMTAWTLSPHTRPWTFCLPSRGVAPGSWSSKSVMWHTRRTEGSHMGLVGLLDIRLPSPPSSTRAPGHLSSLELCRPNAGCPYGPGLGDWQGFWVTAFSHKSCPFPWPLWFLTSRQLGGDSQHLISLSTQCLVLCLTQSQ